MTTITSVRKITLMAAMFSSMSMVYADSDAFAIKVQQYAQTTPLLFRTTKSIAPEQQKLGADLLRLMAQAQSKSIPDSTILMSKSGQLPIHIVAKAGQGHLLEEQLRKMNINVQSRVQDDIMGYIMPFQLTEVTKLNAVDSANLQSTISAENTQNIDVLTQRQDDDGVRATFSSLLHQRNLNGQNIKIGVIDFGYRHYEQLQSQQIVPKPTQAQTFSGGRVQIGLTADSNSAHGTACVEIIHALAPKAEIYIAQIGNGKGVANDGDLLQAMDWLIKQNVNIINFSGGGHGHPHDGTSTLDKKVSQALQKNILWVNSAGNEGNKTWTGKILDQNKNNLIDIGKYDNLVFEKSNNAPTTITLNWDDWKSSKSGYQQINIDALVVTEDPQTGRIIQVAQASEPRTHNSSALKRFTINAPKGRYALILRSNQQSPKAVQVFFHNAELDTAERNASITVPATSPDALAVAAWTVRSASIASYSSIGLTIDGRMKPDLAAPTGVFNRAYQLENAKNPYFHGTSAAAPHVAGFAALLWQQQPTWTAQQLKTFMIQNSTRAIGVRPNYNAGYGMIDARQVLMHSSFAPIQSTPTQQPITVIYPPRVATPVTTAPTTSTVTATPITTAPITSTVTTRPITVAPVTTTPVTTAPVTSTITTRPVTIAPVTTTPITTAPVTSTVTTRPVTPTVTTPPNQPTTPTPSQPPATPNKANEVQDLLKRLGLNK